ncbi:putative ABC transport system permease protein [Pilibacter termitis]|uniref:Putative ABC transport system permease protein n=1 Tax=Pilibacter termitis TaxID=263852 RepID=A0A1T4LXT1_9ENTE|nr:ABC transporter permease [Pilibacter termitis]SJZ59441.1 putative ABC transport system permease protein [Pilibacter termitis]
MLFAKLASQSVRKNKMEYYPFIFGVIVTFVLNTIVQLIMNNPALDKMKGAETLKTLLSFGNVVIVIFTVVFVLYAHSFVAKKRKKEFGLYSVLGMSKRDLRKYLLLQAMFIFAISIVIGLIVGLVFSKAMFLVLVKLLGESNFGLHLEISVILKLVIEFFILFLLIYLVDVWDVQRTKSIDLLKSESIGEKEPKGRLVISLIGVVMLIVAYSMTLQISNPISALFKFFLAVILVIVSTYILYIAGSITILKLMKKNKRFFYQPKHFISVSGMIFRMKQNGVGLANIAILTTMTLVTFVTTVALYAGKEVVIREMAPREYVVNVLSGSEEEKKLNDLMSNPDIKVKNKVTYEVFGSYTGTFEGDVFSNTARSTNLSMLSFMTIEEYEKLTGKNESLNAGEALLFDQTGKFKGKTFYVNKQKFDVKVVDEVANMERLPDFAHPFYMIVKDKAEIEKISADLNKVQKEGGNFSENVLFDISASDKQRTSFDKELVKELGGMARVKSEMESAYKFLTGGFLFIGVLFGFSFILATGLIIYYKQITEGMADQKRFDILQKVGMSHKEVKQTINGQIIWVFALPIATAVVHLLVALPFIYSMIGLFNLNKWSVILPTAVGVVVIISLIYYVIYTKTSKVYYKLVER